MITAKQAVNIMCEFNEGLSKAPTVSQVSAWIRKLSAMGQRNLTLDFLASTESDQLTKVTIALLEAGYRTAREDVNSGMLYRLHVNW